MINPQIFREYDIRGIAEQDLVDENVYLMGCGFGTYYQSLGNKTVIVGHDVRLSSPRVSDSLKKGLVDSGCDVLDIGEVPTPALYFALFHFKLDSGIMITASHNPKEFNGFKVCAGKSTIYGEEIQQLRKIIEKKVFTKGQGKIDKSKIIPDYIKYVTKDIKIKRGLKIVLDTGNGTCGPIAEQIMEKIGADCQILYKEPDGNFPNHLPDPTVLKFMGKLVEAVKKGGYACGVGYDGDGDRIGVIDETGKVIWGDVLLAIYAAEVLKLNPGATIIFEVKCSKGLIERISQLGGVPLMYKTGHSLIKAKMKEEHALLAGEMSGHMFFSDRYHGYDDAIYASLRLLEILSKGKKLSELAAQVPHYFSTPEIRVETTDEKKFAIVDGLKASFMKSYKVIDIDGVRVDFGDGWGLVRASNTQPVLVLRFEAKTKDRLEEIESLFLDNLRKLGINA